MTNLLSKFGGLVFFGTQCKNSSHKLPTIWTPKTEWLLWVNHILSKVTKVNIHKIIAVIDIPCCCRLADVSEICESHHNITHHCAAFREESNVVFHSNVESRRLCLSEGHWPFKTAQTKLTLFTVWQKITAFSSAPKQCHTCKMRKYKTTEQMAFCTLQWIHYLHWARFFQLTWLFRRKIYPRDYRKCRLCQHSTKLIVA